ncbi:MAG: NnrS family protein [Rubrivivax sp.]|nr:NnrS family protein [Rubrivivax sp.]
MRATRGSRWASACWLAAAQMGWTACWPAHALAIGATAGMIIGMITRTARGHTGRLLQVTIAEVAAHVLMMTAATLRVLVPQAAPQWLVPALVGSALAWWSAAFALNLFVFAPWLLRTRLDRKDG